jgi:hypothetical protein
MVAHRERAERAISAWIPANGHQKPPLNNALVEVKLQ